ncbi:nitrate/nitrite-specific signal transduction histidine kinase [Variovorax boronicumulans]|uniref:type IV pili methyl-accepting chemotaxis transducer N-terminal domain-containing protein n=1 Tax=Variovorax boronicumulans TaxID=436515 RepID=UPI00277F9BB0|nr:type IV pili methyl-accepting chemotaxis transducer N-terminal domain-containing protein [Variovorax boronicumulans]MDP9991800.1 nitrate/nitrite-specific signal transduction histidine kinase [Variovorax boronicumulans]MDQ0003828.1 nitrate/nitrite-specific signal transduction histidine kinase [Variovorax boronicumulans]
MKRRLFIASTALVAVGARAQVADLNDAINKAGRQRMLSQRASKAYLAILQKVETRNAQQVLDKSIALFEKQLGELKAFAPSPTIRSTYDALDGAWNDFKRELTGVAASREEAAKVVKLDAAVLALANQGTTQYETASGKPVGRLVNIAGRQRMLSQRMAKFYLAGAMQIDAAGSAAEIAKSRAEFLAALEVLRSAPEATTQIRQELVLADAQWMFFNRGLQRLEGAGASPALMSDVFVTSENLLGIMDRVTGLYSDLKT